MLSDKYPVIIGVPPRRLSEEARGLLVFSSGRDNHTGHRRLTEDDVVTEGIETAKNDAEAPKSRPATQSRASTGPATYIAGTSPNPTYDDLETLLPDGNLAVPPCKTGAQVTVISMPDIQVFDNEDDDPIRVHERSPVLPRKMRAKTRGRAARRLTVWSTDDEDEIEGELPKGDRRNQVDNAKGPGEANTIKRKQRDDADGVASEHQPKRAHTTTRVSDVNAPMSDTFVRTSHGKGNNAFIIQRCSHG
jgi:hypothetical protein